uniref:Uncharacterized protein n=1 Tax=Oryza glaberrima TaxID=4538 RepID=I1R1I7_ORYGL
MWRSDPLHTPPRAGIRRGFPMPFPPQDNPPAARSGDSRPVEAVGGGGPAEWMRGPVLEGSGSDPIGDMQRLLLGLQPSKREKLRRMTSRPGSSEKRRGTWWSRVGRYPVKEGVDFVPNSQGEIGDEFLFVPDSGSDEEEVVDGDSCEVREVDFVPDSQPEDADSVEKIGVGEDQSRGDVAMPNPPSDPHCRRRFFTNSVFKGLLKDLAQEEKARRSYFEKATRQEEDDKAAREKDDKTTREDKSMKASDDDEKDRAIRASGDDKGNSQCVGLDWRDHGQVDDSELW